MGITDDEDRNPAYEGWTSAYSVQSILLQLQCFLLKPGFAQETMPDKEAWIKENQYSVGWSRVDSSGRKLDASERAEAKQNAMERAYIQATADLRLRQQAEARTQKQAMKFICSTCMHSRFDPIPAFPAIPAPPPPLKTLFQPLSTPKTTTKSGKVYRRKGKDSKISVSGKYTSVLSSAFNTRCNDVPPLASNQISPCDQHIVR